MSVHELRNGRWYRSDAEDRATMAALLAIFINFIATPIVSILTFAISGDQNIAVWVLFYMILIGTWLHPTIIKALVLWHLSYSNDLKVK